MEISADMKHWKELQGNPYLVSPTPAMLEPGGQPILRTSVVKGEPRSKGKLAFVVYDKEYCVQYFAKKFAAFNEDERALILEEMNNAIQSLGSPGGSSQEAITEDKT